MENLDLLKSELAMYGIKVAGEHSLIYRGNKEVSLPIPEMLKHLKKEVSKNKKLFYSLWNEMNEVFQQFKFGATASNESTQRMFITAIKHLHKLSSEIITVSKYSRILRIALNQDIGVFSESFMSGVVDFSVAINWVDNMVRSDVYRISLLNYYSKRHGITTAAYADEDTDINGVQGPWSNFDLPMKERVWSFSEDAEDFEESTKKRQNSGRYDLPKTYNSPDEFEQGFYWREIRNDPYRFGDDDSDPYPHDNRWFKEH